MGFKIILLNEITDSERQLEVEGGTWEWADRHHNELSHSLLERLIEFFHGFLWVPGMRNYS